ncbi:efflux RND transporter periplasmic adaptor subunit [Barnesiella sp. An55]|uniref:efflux RND transporter periplasmic adaptor subunit n=1 Tax=Barnesiella sp. An55 TaxID=1965646 RepID=UPI001F150FC3|nr:efflux RND transporter periplasmic adaptor subunit [Barnesiella sp. An55]
MNRNNPMKQSMIYLMLALLAASCSSPSGQQAGSAGTADTVAQAVDDTAQMPKVDGVSGATNVSNPPSFNGVIVMPPQNHVTVTLSMGGSVKDIHILPGKYVRKGEVVLTLANPAFIELQQSYLDAAAQAEYLRKEYERQQKLVSDESASLKRLQQSKADYLSMKSRMEAAAAQLALLGVDTAALNRNGIRTYLDVRAPRSGYVTNMDINAGKYFAAGEPVCDVIDKSNPMLQLTAYEKDLDKLKPGTRFTFNVNGMPDTTFTAELVSVDQMVDNVNRSIKVYARIVEGYSNFRQGMYVSAKITDKKH